MNNNPSSSASASRRRANRPARDDSAEFKKFFTKILEKEDQRDEVLRSIDEHLHRLDEQQKQQVAQADRAERFKLTGEAFNHISDIGRRFDIGALETVGSLGQSLLSVGEAIKNIQNISKFEAVFSQAGAGFFDKLASGGAIMSGPVGLFSVGVSVLFMFAGDDESDGLSEAFNQLHLALQGMYNTMCQLFQHSFKNQMHILDGLRRVMDHVSIMRQENAYRDFNLNQRLDYMVQLMQGEFSDLKLSDFETAVRGIGRSKKAEGLRALKKENLFNDVSIIENYVLDRLHALLLNGANWEVTRVATVGTKINFSNHLGLVLRLLQDQGIVVDKKKNPNLIHADLWLAGLNAYAKALHLLQEQDPEKKKSYDQAAVSTFECLNKDFATQKLRI